MADKDTTSALSMFAMDRSASAGKSGVERPPVPQAVELKMQRIRERQRLSTTYLSNAKAFEGYVHAHPLGHVIQQKIGDEVALNRLQLHVAAETVGIPDVDQLPAIEQYRILVAASNVDPSFVFPEFPPIARQCELQGIWNEYSKLELANPSADVQVILDERDQSNRYFNMRWQILTRESQLVGPPYPPVARLTQLIAPIPYTSTWTAELYGREPVSMRHAVATGRPGAAAPIPSPAPSGGSPSAGAAAGAGVGCNVEDIYRLAGASAPHQPSSPQPDAESAHHTFPGNLRWGEDIFYDYSVMMPLDQCDLDAAPPEFDERRTMAATMSANFAQNILAFLYAQHLDAALGAGVIAELEQQLTAVLGIRVDATTAHVRALRKGLRETAAVVRSLSRMRMLFAAPVVEDFNQLITALDAALTPFDATRLRNPERYLPNSHATEGNQPHGVLRPTLEIIDTADPLNNFYAHVRDNDFFYENGDDLHDGAKPAGWFGIPHAKSNRPENGVFFGGMFEASYSTTRRHEALRRYLQYLGGTFYNNLTTLRERANDARAALDRVRNAPRSRNVLSEFARVSEGVVNEALMALAQLFDDMAEQLPLARSTKAEGSKRLARMVTYRQYWFPEGYVAGKLVGYKNLMPNQKETVKRRTFVKTTRDLTTAEEFAASRDQDFTSSTKETAELVKEASSEFSLSVKTEGGFDFLIVSGDITTDVSTGRKDVSKAMHNRVAEATMKSSIKYNEKREVKLRELTETESLQEVTTEIENLNREITANYFYYQLHRQYVVTTELARVQTVLLRTREVPSPAAVDAKFLSDHAHILLHALPGQLSADLQEAVGEVDLLGRTVIRRRGDLDQKRAMYEQFRLSPMPAAAEEQAAWRAQLDAMERASSEAITAYVEADENYIRARTRIDRVVGHVRENIHYYMQFIWYASPNTDQDKLLQEEEFDHRPLGELTRGFMRVGYYGNEEIFEYTGSSLDGLQSLMDDLVGGSQIVAGMSDAQLQAHPLFQRLQMYYPADTTAMLIDRIQTHVFLRDPASDHELNNTRRVQLAQDALVVESLPGQVPLLEGFQMAHRMLDVQKACLENLHLSERIRTRPWEQHGEDTYTVVRREGEPSALNVSVGDKSASNP